MNQLDLFSGIGGFSLAGERVWGKDHHIHCFVETDLFCQKVLKKHWPNTPIHNDIRTYSHDGTKIDLLTGGFPCQPFSVAGKQRGKEDDRYLWPEMLRVITEVKPTWVIGENVAGIIHMELDKVLSDLEAEGYETQTFIIPACAVDAPHRRDRVWIIAYNAKQIDWSNNTKKSNGQIQQPRVSFSKAIVADARQPRTRMETYRGSGQRGQPARTLESEILRQENGQISSEGIDSGCEDVADALKQQQNGRLHRTCRRIGESEETLQNARGRRGQKDGMWLPEPGVGGTPNGFPMWLYRHCGRGLSCGESTRTTEILRRMWNNNVSQALWKILGGFNRIQKAEILFSFVCQHETCPDKTRILLESKEALKEFVRGLWRQGKITGSSHRSENRKQLQGKHPDSMQALSRLLAFNGKENWQISDWEDGISRVTTGVPRRVERLRSLGNAIVPQVVMPIMEGIKALS